MAKTEPIPGTSDIFPAETHGWRYLEQCAHEVFSKYGFGELRTPIFERTEVFLKSIGDETDIVQKEMYSFEDRGGRNLTLRPEGTASVLRALANLGISQGDEQKVYYIGPMFRGERPAAGRKRQFHQIGLECVGKIAPLIDVESIAMLMDYIKTIGITNTKLLINTRGIKSERGDAENALKAHFEKNIDSMCTDCQRRVSTNVWRILDCKEDDCQAYVENAPMIADMIGDESKSYFAEVLKGLDDLSIDYELDPRLVRGLDYYEHTVFEVIYEGIGAQNAIAGGGRYKIEPPGCKAPFSGVGFALGIERLLLTRADLGIENEGETITDIYLVSLGEAALSMNLKIAHNLRQEGKVIQMNLEDRGIKSQMRSANKSKAKECYILGENEIEKNIIIIKDMDTSEQTEVPLEQFLEG
ncbi:MAG: histidine--tRNA ligase [Lentisphaeria bacterium]|nr:histidine--tRNA ligase [Lentisphaeria bacterium]NQZ70778.1 histidine--tRNA ligase [Lentisphaeria bacterium]